MYRQVTLVPAAYSVVHLHAMVYARCFTMCCSLFVALSSDFVAYLKEDRVFLPKE